MPYTDERDVPDVRFARLEARIDRVADATIRKKWKKLPPSSHNATRNALSVARQQARSRQQGRTKTSQTVENCVEGMLDRLVNTSGRLYLAVTKSLQTM